MDRFHGVGSIPTCGFWRVAMEGLRSVTVTIELDTNKDTHKRTFDNLTEAHLCLRELVNARSLDEQIDMLAADYNDDDDLH